MESTDSSLDEFLGWHIQIIAVSAETALKFLSNNTLNHNKISLWIFFSLLSESSQLSFYAFFT